MNVKLLLLSSIAFLSVKTCNASLPAIRPTKSTGAPAFRDDSFTELSRSSIISKTLMIEGGNIEDTSSVHIELFLTLRKYTPVLVFGAVLNYLFPSLVPDFLSCWWRLVIGGFAVSTALVSLAVPQAIRLSGGAIPKASAGDLAVILVGALPTQTCFKFVQYFALRSLKRGLDTLNLLPNALNTIVSYGITATVMQAAAYNDAIKRTYNYFGRLDMVFKKHACPKKGKIDVQVLRHALKDAKVGDEDIEAIIVQRRGMATLEEFKNLVETHEELARTRRVSVFSMFLAFLHANVLPGILFGFLRECGATGAGIVLRPYVQSAMQPIGLPALPAKIVSGIMSGMTTSLMTQWLHNNAMRAGNMAQTGAIPSSATVLKNTWSELGFRMFYLNADRRVLSTASATTVLGLVDIFA